MFIYNKYSRWYYQIIDSALSQDRKKIKSENLYERHHIIPKSLGGSDKSDNLVLLTYREHFICHWLLTKMVEDRESKRKMLYALACITGKTKSNNRIVSGWQYSTSRKSFTIATKMPRKKGYTTSRKGNNLSDEHIAALKGPRPHTRGPKSYLQGRKLDPESIIKREATRVANGTTNKGRRLSPETIAKRQATRLANMQSKGLDYMGQPLTT